MSRTLSIVLPVYNEAELITETVSTLARELAPADVPLEFIVVDDGSTDDTWKHIRACTENHENVKALAFSRNFGKEQAIHAGLSASRGELVVVMDADLQHPPQTVLAMLKKQRETHCDVVHGIKHGRAHESGATLPVRLFYLCYRFATGVSLAGHTDFKLLTRRVVNSYIQLPERQRFFRGLVPWLGFTQESVTFSVTGRTRGYSKWTTTKRLMLGIGAIRSFSTLPLQLVTVAGGLFFLAALGLTSFTLYDWWSGGAVEGFTTVIILQLIIGSVLMISLGIIGQYLAEIFSEVKSRPAYLVKDSINLHDA